MSSSDMYKNIWDKNIPLKVRKINTIQLFGLPLDETHIFSKEHLDIQLDNIIDLSQSLFKKYGAIFIRTAWEPDLLAAPWFRIRTHCDFSNTISKLKNLRAIERGGSSHKLTHIILHSDRTLPDPKDKLNYVAGRVLFHPEQDIPLDRTLELVHGEYMARIFDTMGFDFSDDRFAACAINVGRMAWSTIKESIFISRSKVQSIVRHLEFLDEKIYELREFLSKVYKCSIYEVFLIIEFEARHDTDDFFFVYDFDFAIKGITNYAIIYGNH